ncbi:MAG: hypothetical protein ACR2M9_03335, partial [Cyanophyceae cyanobacterium]
LYVTLRVAENIALKIADALEFPLTAESLVNNISNYNVNTLTEISNLNLHDFGIFLELEPDEEEQQQLEQNIQVALQQGGIDLEDAIDLRQIKNLKLANQMLKIKRKKKGREEQQNAMQQSQAQANAQADAAEKIAMSEVQKQEAISGSKVQFEQANNQMEIQRMQIAAQIKQQQMQLQHKFDMQLKQMDMKATSKKESEIEDRKDKRIKLEGTQQSQMINQRQNDLLPINFEEQDGAAMMPNV